MSFHILEIKFNFNGNEEAIYPTVIQSGKEILLIDCGYEGFLPKLEEALSGVNLSFNELTGILITHHDIDHMGGLFEIKAKYPHLKVWSSDLEAGYIDGSKKSLRLIQAEDTYDQLPAAYKEGARYFIDQLKRMKAVPVDKVFRLNNEGELLEGVEVIHTPGHMPGHISIYLKHSQTLIAADAVVVENGELEIANPQFTLDMPTALASVKKLERLAIDSLVCYHGGLFGRDASAALLDLTKKYQATQVKANTV
ncbi:MBL fold metallo-hydrolase [uncultured Imperialibacter sp.]|uniref:MBL fold metallo-hydrolase n=1 Tax=uncultured Imperialibacter sp. TaxID=1672639 RepID=UPI0030DDB56A|tara:strand:- start:75 stop:833 length:759 start_codon:yes stop_codon:yes gene_type:complete